MQGTLFESNAGIWGGGLRLDGGSLASLVNSTFVANMAALGSAILVHDGSVLDQIANCNIVNNTQLLEYNDGSGVTKPIDVFSQTAIDLFINRCAMEISIVVVHDTTSESLHILALWHQIRFRPCQLLQQTPSCRSGANLTVDAAVLSQFAQEDGMTILGGAVHVFRGCIHAVVNTSFCANGGLPLSTMLANKGALYFENPACLTHVNGSYFEGNQVPLDGGAIQVQSAVRGLLPDITSCTFERNHAQRFGGAIAVSSVTGDLTVRDCVFHENSACSGGGAASFVSTAHVTVERCLFTDNSAIIQGCQGQQDRAWSPGHGGAILHVRTPASFCLLHCRLSPTRLR